MNLLDTLAESGTMTVRQLINKSNSLVLSKGLVQAGLAETDSELYKIRDEILVWDEEGNTLVIPRVSGVYFQPVKYRHPNSRNPKDGPIIASLKETKKVEHYPFLTTRTNQFRDTVEYMENNDLHFYRADHPDVMPFLSLSALWLAVPTFHDLLAAHGEGKYSALADIAEVHVPDAELKVSIPFSLRMKYSDVIVPVDFEKKHDVTSVEVASSIEYDYGGFNRIA